MQERISVGLGECVVSNNPDEILISYGLGSCVGVAAYDKKNNIAGLLHVMLPIAGANVSNSKRAKFADTGIPMLLEKVAAMGGQKRFLTIKIAGGARMFNINSSNTIFDVGDRNIVQVKSVLKKEGLKIVSEDVGLNYGRTMQLYVSLGKVVIRTFGKGEKEL